MTKRFMHVSIAILCLALAYHVGYRNAGAQAPGNPVVDFAVDTFSSPRNNWVLTANGDVYRSVGGGTWTPTGNPSGGTEAVAFAVDTHANPRQYWVAYANGDIYMNQGSGWQYAGNVFGGPTPVEGASLGQVKLRYR